jgi:hypothetical protein
MTEEQKEIVLLGSRFEILNKYIDFSKDGVIEREEAIKAMQEYAELYHVAQLRKLRQGDVIGSYAIVRWYDNKDEDVVCTTREVAEDYVKKYNALCGKEKCFVDSEIWLPLREA